MTIILLTGATDGIGLATAKRLAAEGHELILHGRNPDKLASAVDLMTTAQGDVTSVLADLSRPADVQAMARRLAASHPRIDVIINNAGVCETPHVETEDGLDVRFAVNTIAAYVLAVGLLGAVPRSGRIVNLSSAAQAPVDLDAMVGTPRLAAFDAYAQSKLALTMWNAHLAAEHPDGPAFIAVNPGSYLGTKMVQEGFGVAGNDIGIGVEILCRAALGADFADASGRYWDNDAGGFATPHPDATDTEKNAALVARIEAFLGG